MHSLRQIFPNTDYNRAIDIDKLAEIWPNQIIRLNRIMAEKVANIIGYSAEVYKDELSSYDGKVEAENNTRPEEKNKRHRGLHPGFIEVEKYEASVVTDFNDQLDEDEELGPALKKIKKLADKVEFGTGTDLDEDTDNEDDVS